MKQIDINKSIYDLSQEYPEVIEIMESIGFKDIGKKGMLNTAGRIMTIQKGAVMKGIEMDKIIKVFEDRGFSISKEEE